jgi:hypothetical protein
MDEILKLEFITDLNYFRITIDIVLLFACSKLIEITYKKYTYSNDNKLLFTNHMFNFLMAIFLIVTVIKSSIALSLGLVGALSIIRFRTAIKEPGQLINLLILTALAISMAAEKEVLGILVTLLYFLHSFFNKKRNKSENNFSKPSLLRASIKNENLNIDEILNYENLMRIYKDENEIVHIEIEISSNKDKLNSVISNLKSNFTLITYEVL